MNEWFIDKSTSHIVVQDDMMAYKVMVCAFVSCYIVYLVHPISIILYVNGENNLKFQIWKLFIVPRVNL